jgi:hypothetical protein
VDLAEATQSDHSIRMGNAAGGRYTVAGLYLDKGEVWVNQLLADSYRDALEKAMREVASKPRSGGQENLKSLFVIKEWATFRAWPSAPFHEADPFGER